MHLKWKIMELIGKAPIHPYSFCWNRVVFRCVYCYHHSSQHSNSFQLIYWWWDCGSRWIKLHPQLYWSLSYCFSLFQPQTYVTNQHYWFIIELLVVRKWIYIVVWFILLNNQCKVLFFCRRFTQQQQKWKSQSANRLENCLKRLVMASVFKFWLKVHKSCFSFVFNQ